MDGLRWNMELVKVTLLQQDKRLTSKVCTANAEEVQASLGAGL